MVRDQAVLSDTMPCILVPVFAGRRCFWFAIIIIVIIVTIIIVITIFITVIIINALFLGFDVATHLHLRDSGCLGEFFTGEFYLYHHSLQQRLQWTSKWYFVSFNSRIPGGRTSTTRGRYYYHRATPRPSPKPRTNWFDEQGYRSGGLEVFPMELMKKDIVKCSWLIVDSAN